MKEVMNCVQIIEKKMDAVKATKSKVRKIDSHGTSYSLIECVWIDKERDAAQCGQAVWKVGRSSKRKAVFVVR